MDNEESFSTAGLSAVYFHYNSVAFIHSLVMSTIVISKLVFFSQTVGSEARNWDK